MLLGDPPSLDGDDADPHCCARPFDAVAVPSRAAAAACLATWARGLLFGANGVAAGGRLANPTTRAGMPPGAATASVATTASASIKDPEIVPSCPASRQMVSRSRRAAVFGMLPRYPSGQHAPLRSAPAAPIERHGESVPNAGASPRPLRNALASRKRHPDAGGHAWPPRPHAGFPPAVRSPGLPE